MYENHTSSVKSKINHCKCNKFISFQKVIQKHLQSQHLDGSGKRQGPYSKMLNFCLKVKRKETKSWVKIKA